VRWCDDFAADRDMSGGPCSPCESCEQAANVGRNEGWLEAAAKEIGGQLDSLSTWVPPDGAWEDIIAILRKHRDGQ
jgi:hypothetical protein